MASVLSHSDMCLLLSLPSFSQIGLCVVAFFMRIQDVKYLLHVYCLLDIVIIFPSRGGLSFFVIYPITCYVPGMRKGISNISSDRLRLNEKERGEKIQMFDPWNVLFIDFSSTLLFPQCYTISALQQ